MKPKTEYSGEPIHWELPDLKWITNHSKPTEPTYYAARARVSVTETVPVPGVTKGGAVYGSGIKSIGGSSSPSRQMGIIFTITSVLVPTSGIGDIRGGTMTGGNMVIRIMSPVFMMKSAGINRPL